MTTLFTLAVQSTLDPHRWTTLVHGSTRDQFIARLTHDGVDRRIASDWATELALAADNALTHAAGPKRDATHAAYCATGDTWTHHSAGPRGESYTMCATAIMCALPKPANGTATQPV
jgi:hypothetical protein